MGPVLSPLPPKPGAISQTYWALCRDGACDDVVLSAQNILSFTFPTFLLLKAQEPRPVAFLNIYRYRMSTSLFGRLTPLWKSASYGHHFSLPSSKQGVCLPSPCTWQCLICFVFLTGGWSPWRFWGKGLRGFCHLSRSKASFPLLRRVQPTRLRCVHPTRD